MKQLYKRVLNWKNRIVSNAQCNDISPRVGYLFQTPQNIPRETTLIDLLEFDSVDLDDFVAASVDQLKQFERLVFFTTATDLRPFRWRNQVVETVPSLTDIQKWSPGRPWERYLRRRRELVIAKWRPNLILSYGMAYDGYCSEINNLSKRL